MQRRRSCGTTHGRSWAAPREAGGSTTACSVTNLRAALSPAVGHTKHAAELLGCERPPAVVAALHPAVPATAHRRVHISRRDSQAAGMHRLPRCWLGSAGGTARRRERAAGVVQRAAGALLLLAARVAQRGGHDVKGGLGRDVQHRGDDEGGGAQQIEKEGPHSEEQAQACSGAAAQGVVGAEVDGACSAAAASAASSAEPRWLPCACRLGWAEVSPRTHCKVQRGAGHESGRHLQQRRVAARVRGHHADGVACGDGEGVSQGGAAGGRRLAAGAGTPAPQAQPARSCGRSSHWASSGAQPHAPTCTDRRTDWAKAMTASSSRPRASPSFSCGAICRARQAARGHGRAGASANRGDHRHPALAA